MSENTIENIEVPTEVQPIEVPPVEVQKRKRGRPRVIKPPKPVKKNGRPLKYPEGSRDHRRKTVKIPKEEYKLYLEMKSKYDHLLEVEKKYLDLIKIITE